MGGRAFKDLDCPRMAPDVYIKVKSQVTIALRTIFTHVVVPTEMPEKTDYGDVDFLVAPSSGTIINKFDWKGTVDAIKNVLKTAHGRHGFLTPDCMYFAIAAPGNDEKYWIQIDVKVCFKPELFTWYTFEYNYASNSRIIGSMIKPLGFTIDLDGLHVRVEELETSNFPDSLIWVSKDPKDVLRMLGLDSRFITAGFTTKAEMYESICSSWLFNAAHFTERMKDAKYARRIEERAPHWMHFIKDWLPEHYPCHQDSAGQDVQLQAWYAHTRAAARDKIFIMFPKVAEQYYIKRAAHVKELEEHRLCDMIMQTIPEGAHGWTDDFPQPPIAIKQRAPLSLDAGELTPPHTSRVVTEDPFNIASKAVPDTYGLRPQDLCLYLDPLDRTPPFEYAPRPPPANMSTEAKLLCLARWTDFDPTSGSPHLLSVPHCKKFKMQWAAAAYAGATDKILRDWSQTMWWHIWMRQSHVNFVGMWKKRFEKEDRKAESSRQKETDAKVDEENVTEGEGAKILGRLRRLNKSLGEI